MPTVTKPLIALLLASLACAALAEEAIYKVRLKDGSIVFTDRVPPGAQVLEKKEGAPPPALLPAVPKATREAADRRLRDHTKAQNRLDADVAAAEEAVAKAKAELEQGREFREGDRIGTVRAGGRGTRPGPAYEERIQSLEQAVVEAEQRLAKAREAREALR